MTDDSLCRNLQKGWWLLIVLLLVDIGAVVWLYDRPGRFAATNPDDDEEFLRRCRERAEEQRRRYQEQKRKAEKQSDGEDQADGR